MAGYEVVVHPAPMRFKGYRFPTDIILLSVRWYLRYGRKSD